MVYTNGVKRQRTSSVKYEITYGDIDDEDEWRVKTRHKNVDYTEPDSDEFESEDSRGTKRGVSTSLNQKAFPVILSVGASNARVIAELIDDSQDAHVNGQKKDDDADDAVELADEDVDEDEDIHTSASKRRNHRQHHKSSRADDDDDDVVISSEDDADDADDLVSDGSDDVAPRARKRRPAPSSRNGSRKPKSQPQNSSDDDYSEGEDNDELEEELEMREELADLQDDDDILTTPVRKHLRARKDIDYRIPLPNEVNDSSLAIEEPSVSAGGRRGGSRGGFSGPLRRLFPITGPFGGSDTVSIFGGGMNPPPGGQNALGGGPQPILGDSDSSDDDMIQPVSGGGAGNKNSPLGVVNNKKKASLADTDPLGIDTNIDFSAVGGLDDYINQLKEMITLPLRYPEVYQQFGVTPPRGVLFHGPPGTGKTLMARALAASCSHDGKQITFYMRKGADCLSKWVGEAERQLRVLFEEARNNQPSIIFFDEIDGLAPVRSSKQEQIHASIVSTLLALMDGMDNRGQVIVIGATNRPDSIDPALRRPGRFDREFYFPLPDLQARKQIISIQTKKWSPPLHPDFVEEIARLTKGYGGADLRALCTESALNAIQRRYPQIYMSDKKLLIDPTTIHVSAVDFMKSVEKIIPSSARSTSSDASALPRELEPLLGKSFARVVQKIDHIVPKKKKKQPLEDALYENPHSDFKQQEAYRTFQRSRVFRPRLLICGSAGMGQNYLGAAILNHLEGYHVQSFDLGIMFGDATRPPEATIVQLMIEVKRHTPSVIYIPDVENWLSALSEQARTAFFGILHGLTPNDEILVLGLAETDFSELSQAAKALFGFSTENYHNLTPDSSWDKEKIEQWFSGTLDYIRSKPTDYPDYDNRKRRVLEELPEAPPDEKKRDESTDASTLRQLERSELQLKNLLKFKLSNLMEHFKNRYKRFRKPPIDDSQLVHLFDSTEPSAPALEGPAPYRPYSKVEGEDMILEVATGKKFYNMDLDIIEERLWNGFYCSPAQFLRDIKMIYLDSQTTGDRERAIKASEMLASTQMTVGDIAANDPQFYQKCRDFYAKYKAKVKEEKERQGNQAPIVRDARLDDDDDELLAETTEVEPATNGETSSVTALPAEVAVDVIAEPAATEAFDITQSTVTLESDKEKDTSLLATPQPPPADSIDVEMSEAPSPVKPANVASALVPAEVVEKTEERAATPSPETKPEKSAAKVDHTETPANVTSVPIPQEPTPEPEPPFILDETAVHALQSKVVNWCAEKGLALEELEQLNAALVDAIWRSRQSWDRGVVIGAVHKAFEEVQKMYD